MQKKRTEGSAGSVSMLRRRYCVPGYGSGKLRSAPPRVLWVSGIGCVRGKTPVTRTDSSFDWKSSCSCSFWAYDWSERPRK